MYEDKIIQPPLELEPGREAACRLARQGMPSLPSILRRRFILKSGKQIMKEYRKTFYKICGDDTAAIIIPEEFILVRLINTEIKKALSMKFRPR